MRTAPAWATHAQIDANSCQVYWIIQSDIGGWIGFINVRSVTGQQLIQLLTNLRKYLIH